MCKHFQVFFFVILTERYTIVYWGKEKFISADDWKLLEFKIEVYLWRLRSGYNFSPCASSLCTTINYSEIMVAYRKRWSGQVEHVDSDPQLIEKKNSGDYLWELKHYHDSKCGDNSIYSKRYLKKECSPRGGRRSKLTKWFKFLSFQLSSNNGYLFFFNVFLAK